VPLRRPEHLIAAMRRLTLSATLVKWCGRRSDFRGIPDDWEPRKIKFRSLATSLRRRK
jgi:hypothetical protein